MDSPIPPRVASKKIFRKTPFLHIASSAFATTPRYTEPTEPEASSRSSKKMRILTRYILREVTSHALLGGALFTFIIFTRDLGKILEFVVRDSATYADVVRIIAYTLPNALVVTIPIAVLVGILLGLSRLAADSEITAMRAAGLGALDFVKIVSIVSAAALGLGLP